jgi:anti-sigma factor ChrR (cupin superfamily)
MNAQMRALMITATVAVVTSVLAVQVGARQMRETDPVVLRPDQLTWQPRGEGVQVAVLYGDPDKPGPFTLRLRYPAGYRKAPHTHPNDAYVTVLEGSYFRGYGNTFDEARGHKLTPGTFSVNPAGVSHYEWTTEPAMLQVQAMGPWTTAYVQAGTNR